MLPRLVALGLSLGAGCLLAAENPKLITYDPLPTGSLSEPFLLRTYFPDPDLDPAVFANHHAGAVSPRYNPSTGQDVPGEYQPVPGIPAAIGVNHGPELSYVFDTTEGRVLYAWQGGFVDLFPYWGDSPQQGNRVGNNYVPRLVGTVFYKAAGRNPLEIDGRSVSEMGKPRFVGYDLVKGHPTFIVRFGEHTVRTRLQPLERQQGVQLELTVEPAARLTYRSEDPRYVIRQQPAGSGALRVTLMGTDLGAFAGYPRRINFTEATAAVGEQLARNYACVSCHTTDGSLSHGPSWTGLADSDRKLLDGTTVKADAAYLTESIKAPNAKIAAGFAPNFMPPYVLRDLEIEALVLYIKSVKQPD